MPSPLIVRQLAPLRRLCPGCLGWVAAGLWLSGLGSSPGWAQALASPSAPVLVALPPTLALLAQQQGVGRFVLGQPLTDLLPFVTACHPVKGERVACLAPQLTVTLDSLQLTGLTLLSYTGLLYGLYLPPCPVAATPALLRWLRAHYGPGQALGKGQLMWPGPVVTVVYEPVVTWKRVERSRTASVAQVQGVVGVLSTPLLARAQADQTVERAVK